MKQQLKKSVVEHLESARLDPARLRTLEDMQQVRHRKTWWRGRWQAVVVALLLLVVGVVSVPWQEDDAVMAVANEVALNHLKRRPLEVEGASVAAVEGYFDELGFRLLETSRPALGAQMLGGRYCNVRGVTAAQLRRVDGSGRTQTLYQVPYDARRFGDVPRIGQGEGPRSVQVRGLTVDLWVEHGLLFALTRE